MRKKTAVILLVVMLAGILAACSNKEDSEENNITARNTEKIVESETQSNAETEVVSERVAVENGDALIEDTVQETEDTTRTTENTAEMENQNSGSSILITYFTVPETDGVDASSGASRRIINGEVIGSTQVIAQMIQNSTGGDLFAIETVQEYPGSHEPLVDQAAEEQEEDARPELATHVENMDQYDIIYIGYPNWWGDMPMPLYTFLEEYDLSGKILIPFTTHGGSSLSNTVQSIASEQPEATVIEHAFSISRDEDFTAAQETVDTWLQEIGMM